MKVYFQRLFLLLISQMFFLPSFLVSAEKQTMTITQFEVNNLPQFSLYISVTDKTGRPVRLPYKTLLPDSDLIKVFEDEKQVTVNEITPVLELENSEISRFYIALVLDNSDSMTRFIRDAKIAADQFIGQIRKDDKVAIVMFDPNAAPYKARLVQTFTNIKHVLKSRTTLSNLTSKTYLYDAIYVACYRLRMERTIGRKAVVVLSDGKDIGSKLRKEQVILLARYEDIPVYAIDFSRSGDNPSLRKISAKTNGKYFRASRAKELAKLYEAILDQLQGQYRITYTTSNENWSKPQRKMRVEVKQINKILTAERIYAPDVARLQYLALRYKEAVSRVDSEEYIEYINTYPGSEWCDDIKFKLGVFYEQRGKYDQSLEIYDELIESHETEWKDDVLFRKGKIYQTIGDYANAIENYERLIAECPEAKNAPHALLGLARSCRETHDMARAEQNYQRIKQEYSGSEVTDEALLELSMLKIQQGRTNEGKRYLMELVENYKESNSTAEAYMSLSSLSEKNGELREAVEYCSKATKSTDDPAFISKAFSKKGNLLYTMGEFKSAIDAFGEILNRYDTYGYKDEAFLGIAQSYRKQENYQPMRMNYEKIEQMKSQNEAISFDLIEINSVTELLPPKSGYRVTTLSGASLETKPNNETSYPVEITIKPVATAEQFQNLAIAGSIYDISASTDTFITPVKISLPYQQSWIDSADKKIEDFELYTYHGTQWQRIPGSQVDSVNKVITAEVTSLSLKAIMFQPPRVIRFDDILFELNSADLTEDTKMKVDTVVAILQASDKIRLEVQGHTDSTGGYDYNLELSAKRAETIRNYIVGEGIDSTRIIPNGYADRFPIASNLTEAGRALNRRTEFVIISKGENDIIDVQQRQLGTKYTIQLGNKYQYLYQAAEQSEILKKEGYQITVKPELENGQTVYYLWCGYFDDPDEAENFAKKIVNQYINLSYTIIER